MSKCNAYPLPVVDELRTVALRVQHRHKLIHSGAYSASFLYVSLFVFSTVS